MKYILMIFLFLSTIYCHSQTYRRQNDESIEEFAKKENCEIQYGWKSDATFKTTYFQIIY